MLPTHWFESVELPRSDDHVMIEEPDVNCHALPLQFRYPVLNDGSACVRIPTTSTAPEPLRVASSLKAVGYQENPL
jgi:hypothetical protein